DSDADITVYGNHTFRQDSNTTSQTGISIAPAATLGLGIKTAGGDEAHENRPPYYALYYIMKIQTGVHRP
ncbi:MAG: hypothetical protein HRT35_29095, partial [Algicola sp.]|nr:hypothetical protein [Algicola sp.]